MLFYFNIHFYLYYIIFISIILLFIFTRSTFILNNFYANFQPNDHEDALLNEK